MSNCLESRIVSAAKPIFDKRKNATSTPPTKIPSIQKAVGGGVPQPPLNWQTKGEGFQSSVANWEGANKAGQGPKNTFQSSSELAHTENKWPIPLEMRFRL